MEFSIGDRVTYAGGDDAVRASAGEQGTVCAMPGWWSYMEDNTTMVYFENHGEQEVLTDCLALA